MCPTSEAGSKFQFPFGCSHKTKTNRGRTFAPCYTYCAPYFFKWPSPISVSEKAILAFAPIIKITRNRGSGCFSARPNWQIQSREDDVAPRCVRVFLVVLRLVRLGRREEQVPTRTRIQVVSERGWLLIRINNPDQRRRKNFSNES